MRQVDAMPDLNSLDYFNQSAPIRNGDIPFPMRKHWEKISGYGLSGAELDSVFWADFYEFIALAYRNEFRPPVSKWAVTFKALGFRNPGTLATTFHNCYSVLKANQKLEKL